MSKIFETQIVKVGPEAQNMISDANMLILFGVGAPADLADYCFTHNQQTLSGTIQVGSQLAIDGQTYPITFVGHLVEKNLTELGHITIDLTGLTEGGLPGTLSISATEAPRIGLNSVLEIFD